MRTPTDSSDNISPNKPISEISAIGRYAGFKMSWTTGQEKHLATKRQVFYSWICSNHWYHSVALEIRIQGPFIQSQCRFGITQVCSVGFAHEIYHPIIKIRQQPNGHPFWLSFRGQSPRYSLPQGNLSPPPFEGGSLRTYANILRELCLSDLAVMARH